jgi:tetratricopeptide (TPR) repeat protein
MPGRRLLAALVLCLSAFGTTPLSAQTGTDDQRADELIQQGDWVQAASVLRSLVARKATATRLFNLAQAERNLGRIVDAKRHFEAALDAAQREQLDAVQAAARDAAQALDARLGRIDVELPEGVDGVVVRLEGRRIDLARARSLEVDPGAHRLLVSAPGHASYERELVLREGQRVRVKVVLQPLSEPAAPIEPERAGHEASPLPPAPVWVLGGVGVAALASGVAFHFVADSKYDEAASACRDDGDRFVCPENLERDPRHQELKDEAASAQTMRNVLFAVSAGALVAGGVWWALAPRSARSPEVGVSVSPTATSARLRVPIF